ncbi:minor capsid protein [Caldalkalibacillus thermarum TA2.A1]|uniref:Minor capsid protein n=1 Tax=Caldalkalibacillus thermarum (strain TA2.A1) TaxID=986075 RepID=A0A8X8I9I4_CALTT|nr:minor capsid protein [Caldalkalibacillus thermarum]QZT33988.1 minor capsid protein [Caldalkalibacillus thermarum TA2.A1]
MINFNIKVELDKIAPKLEKAMDKGQVALDTQVLKDSNNYAPQDTSNLINSGIRLTNPGSGKVMWDGSYARRLYYNPQYNFSKDKNPNAGGLWFERAKSRHFKEWVQVAEKAAKQNL